MNNNLDILHIEEPLLAHYENAEIFKSIHESSIIEICHGTSRSISSKKVGAAVRINDINQKMGRMYSSHKVEIVNNWFCSANMNEIPYYSLPFIKVSNKKDIPNIIFDSTDCLLAKLETCKSIFRESGITIEKLAIEENFGLFALANTHGIRGTGHRYLCSINCLLKRKNGNMFEGAKTFDWTEKDSAISTFLD